MTARTHYEEQSHDERRHHDRARANPGSRCQAAIAYIRHHHEANGFEAYAHA